MACKRVSFTTEPELLVKEILLEPMLPEVSSTSTILAVVPALSVEPPGSPMRISLPASPLIAPWLEVGKVYRSGEPNWSPAAEPMTRVSVTVKVAVLV